MGYGEVGSNGSVHWTLNYKESGPPDHVDYDDTKKHPGNTGNPKAQVIGSGKPKGDHPGKFRVTARYQNPPQAEAALQQALAELYPNPGEARAGIRQALAKLNAANRIAILDVDLRPFDTVAKSPGNPDDWEVRVDW
jgi:hypothetical protein